MLDLLQGYSCRYQVILVFDIYSNDGTKAGFFKFLSTTQTYQGVWDDNAGSTAADRTRPALSRNAAGDKILSLFRY